MWRRQNLVEARPDRGPVTPGEVGRRDPQRPVAIVRGDLDGIDTAGEMDRSHCPRLSRRDAQARCPTRVDEGVRRHLHVEVLRIGLGYDDEYLEAAILVAQFNRRLPDHLALGVQPVLKRVMTWRTAGARQIARAPKDLIAHPFQLVCD